MIEHLNPGDAPQSSVELIRTVNRLIAASNVQERAISSIMDVVEELANGAADGQTPDIAWIDVLSQSFASHRRELATGEIEEDPDGVRG